MATYWKIALLGTDTAVAVDTATSEVLLSDLGTSDPLSDAAWLHLDVLGLEPQQQIDAEPVRRVGNVQVNELQQRWEYRVKIAPLRFPSEMATYEAIFTHIGKPNLYLYRGTYPHAIHAAGKALAVACTGVEVEHDYEAGAKNVVLQVQRVYPVP